MIENTVNGQKAEFIVVLTEQANLSEAKVLATKIEKSNYVRDALWTKSLATQRPVLQWLDEQGIEHRSFYIVNAIWLKGTREIAEALAARPDVLRVEGNPHIQNFPLPSLNPFHNLSLQQWLNRESRIPTRLWSGHSDLQVRELLLPVPIPVSVGPITQSSRTIALERNRGRSQLQLARLDPR